MMQMILSFTRNDERIRVVGMEGSRVNVNVPKDKFRITILLNVCYRYGIL